MSAIENVIKDTLKKELSKRMKNSDFQEQLIFLAKIQREGFLNPQDYTIAPLDTVGKRRYQNLRK